jgi:hypothetical protein
LRRAFGVCAAQRAAFRFDFSEVGRKFCGDWRMTPTGDAIPANPHDSAENDFYLAAARIAS